CLLRLWYLVRRHSFGQCSGCERHGCLGPLRIHLSGRVKSVTREQAGILPGAARRYGDLHVASADTQGFFAVDSVEAIDSRRDLGPTPCPVRSYPPVWDREHDPPAPAPARELDRPVQQSGELNAVLRDLPSSILIVDPDKKGDQGIRPLEPSAIQSSGEFVGGPTRPCEEGRVRQVEAARSQSGDQLHRPPL